MAIQAATLSGLPMNHYPYPYYYGHTNYPADADLRFHHLHFNLCVQSVRQQMLFMVQPIFILGLNRARNPVTPMKSRWALIKNRFELLLHAMPGVDMYIYKCTSYWCWGDWPWGIADSVGWWLQGHIYSGKFLYGANFCMHTKKHYQTFEPSNFLMNFNFYSCRRGSY